METPLDQLNNAAVESAEATLLTCCGSRRWARRVAGHRPYPDPQSLLAAADEASYDLTDQDVAEALAAESGAQHPSEGPGALAAHTALRAAHAAYESRFGYAFVICLDGLPPEERLDAILAGIRTRLGHEAEQELAITADELRRLAQGRLLRLVVRDLAAGSPTGRSAGRPTGSPAGRPSVPD
ncbi:2-oxo-4-hydroxy-4-carboxy-5-ureidoimidazoline decarboxylase [Streptomyces gobiensis]|nr:2-oxo-4-hydroxy-4-carboxy-5-ureidoimidazoline decarboxylase [Streptomyces gobiensis]UGY95184.1 2-oxo-4-hydroxy-4-carboxy-5-ureidoimidazoline decarboxylase [Streptomyces gobiensis]